VGLYYDCCVFEPTCDSVVLERRVYECVVDRGSWFAKGGSNEKRLIRKRRENDRSMMISMTTNLGKFMNSYVQYDQDVR